MSDKAQIGRPGAAAGRGTRAMIVLLVVLIVATLVAVFNRAPLRPAVGDHHALGH